VYLGITIGMLALLGGVLYRVRLMRAVTPPRALTDDMVRQIEESGWVEVDEPLDFEAIREEEERFLEEEAWEEPDEW
jgi:hypothetical protein